MTLRLRDYQERAVRQVLERLDRRPILVAPTGSGKTVMAVEVARRLGRRVLWLAHRRELIEQAARHLRGLGAMVGIIKAGVEPTPLAPIQVASVQTLVRRLDDHVGDYGLVIIDECHHATADSYGRILDAFPNARRLGLTATPFRLDGRGLGDLFGELIVAAYTDELVAAGVLHAPRVWASRAPDLRGVWIVRGDYSPRGLAQRTNRPELIGDIVETWKRRAWGLRTVAFAVSVEHSRSIAAAFREAGVPAEHLDGATPEAERAAVLERLARGDTLVVSNCMVLTEGWDLPSLQCAIIARPTASLNLHLQMIGRIMRACEGKQGAIVLDHAGNHHVHGLVTRRLTYSLEPDHRTGEGDPLGLRRCRACGLFFEPTRWACPECGWAPQPSDYTQPQTAEGELVEFDDRDFAYRREVWRLLETERVAAGYAEGWSRYRFKERFGEWPVVANGELVDPASASLAEKRAVYEDLLRVAEAKGFKRGWAAHRYRDIFGVWPGGGIVSAARRERILAKMRGEAAEEDESPF